MLGQGTIVGVGAMEYPAPFAGMSDEKLAELAVSKIITLTSTYDHRIIQGAQSGEFLKVIHELVLGEHGFYDEIFTVAAHPVRAGALDARRRRTRPRAQIDKAARVIELIHAYRVRGHLMADTDPLEFKIRQPPRPRRARARPDAVGPRPHVPGRRIRRPAEDEAARDPRRPARLLLPPGRRRVHAHPGPGGAALDPGPGRAQVHQAVLRGAEARPQPAQRGRGVRDLPADQVRGPEAVLAGGRRVADPAARRGAAGLRRGRPRRGRHRHGPPRPAQRARQHRRQAVREDLLRVRGAPRPEVGARLRRREVPPRPGRQVHHPRRRARDHRLASSRTRPTWRRSTR